MVKPRIVSIPKGNSDLGKRAVELSAEAGYELDEWQAYVLEASMRCAKDGRWAAREVGVNVPRQNGKNIIIQARELAELILVKSELTIHSAHEFKTARQHFFRMADAIENTPRLSKELKVGRFGSTGIRRSHGEEGFDFKGGRSMTFSTRTKGAGRGFSCDLLVMDEAMVIAEASMAALFPMKRARPNPQVWFTGSAVDQQIHEHGVVWSAVRKRGIEGAPALAYFEWSVEGDNPSAVPQSTLEDRAAWAEATPSLGIRISLETMEEEYLSLKHLPRTFAVELLGIGDWPNPDFVSSSPISLAAWMELEDTRSKTGEDVAFAFDVSPDRRGSISVASLREDGLWHVEVIEERAGNAWLPKRLAELVKAHYAGAVACDGFGGSASLIPAIEAEGVEVLTVTAQEHAQACGRFVDLIGEGNLRHIGQAELTGAVRAAATRPLGDAWAWSRKSSSANISPLVSVTLALSAAMTAPDSTPVIVLPAVG